MKSFYIEITELEKGPEELKLQLPVKATAIKQIPGKDRPDYIIAKLEKPVIWVDKAKDKATDITYIVVCSRYKGQNVDKDMENMKVAIAYVTDDSLATDNILSFKKCHYVAIGKATGRSKWSLFG